MYEEVSAAVEAIGTKLDGFRDEMTGLVREERERREALERKVNENRLTARPTADGLAPTWIDAESKQRIPVLHHGQKLADLSEHKGEVPSLGRMLRGLILGSKADDWRELREEMKALAISSDASGGILVPDVLSARWVDLLRAQSVLSQAGVTTIPMPSKSLTVARVTADPVVSWRAENAAFADAQPSFGACTLTARTVACVVKLSLELAQDAANIEQIIEATLTGATAAAIDSAGLVGTTVDAGAAPTGIFNATGRNTVTGVGAPTSWDFVLDGMYELLADRVPADRIGALIAHPALWKKMAKLRTGIASDNTPLPMPADVAKLPKLYTTAAPFTGGNTCKAALGDWADYLFGVRKDITVRVLSESFMGSNLQVGVLVYARCDFAPARPTSFVTLEGITV